jgi:hypothetical protein
MKFIFLSRITTMRFPVKVACFFVFCILTCANSLNWTSAQTKQQQSGDAAVTLSGEEMEWGEGPDFLYARSVMLMPDGSALIDIEYGFKSGKAFKAGVKDCAKNAFRVVDDSNLLDLKGHTRGRRILLTIRDINNRESAILCRSETKKRRLRKIYGQAPAVLAFELSEFPK